MPSLEGKNRSAKASAMDKAAALAQLNCNNVNEKTEQASTSDVDPSSSDDVVEQHPGDKRSTLAPLDNNNEQSKRQKQSNDADALTNEDESNDTTKIIVNFKEGRGQRYHLIED